MNSEGPTARSNLRLADGRRWLRSKWAITIAVVLVIYALTGFFLLPAIVKSQMLQRLPALTKRAVTVRQVRMNPFTLSLTIRGFALTETNAEAFVSFDEFYVNFQLVSLFKRAFVFKEISLTKPFGSIIFLGDGRFNFSNLVTDTVPPPPAGPRRLPRLIVEHLSITNGAVSFADLTRPTPFRSQMTPINITLENLSTLPKAGSPYSIVARSDTGGAFSWAGDVTLNPLQSSGTFKLTGLELKRFGPYLRDFARCELVNGRLYVGADYRYDSTSAALDLDVAKAQVVVRDLQLQSPDTGETVIAIPEFAVRQAQANLVRQTARVGSVSSTGGRILARLEKDGSVNLLSLLVTNHAAKTAAAPATVPEAKTEKTPPWKVNVDEFKLADFTIQAEDRSRGKPVKLTVDQLRLAVKGISLETNATLATELSLRCDGTGTVSVTGRVWPFQGSGDVQVQVDNLDLRPFDPYLEQQFRMAITGGALDTKGRVQFAAAGTNAPSVKFTGDVALKHVATVDTVSFQNFVTWDALQVRGIDLDLQPKKVEVEEVRWTGLKTHVIILTNRSSNLAVMFQTPATTGPAPAPAGEPSPPAGQGGAAPSPEYRLKLGALVLEGATIRFSDQSVEPQVTTAIEEFTGSVKGLSSVDPTNATVELTGKVDGRSPFTVTGQVNPLARDLAVDLQIGLKNCDLTPASPYAGKFAGYVLAKGKLSLDLKYLVNHRALQAENKVRVDQLKMGQKTSSPDATSLPVKLAIALLQDRNGVIALDVPVNGNLNDPKFKLGPIIMQVFMNILTKAITKPFALLGSLFGGGEELSFVNFVPGSTEFTSGETQKMDTLAKALYNRPGLELEITGSIDATNDRVALARIKLDQQIKARRIKELVAGGGAAVSVDTVKIDPKDYDRLVKLIYVEVVGTNPVVTAQQPSAPAEAPEPKQNFSPRNAPAGPKPEEKPTMHLPASLARAIADLTVPEMETRIVDKIAVTPDEFRGLMQGRADQVQKYLLQTGQVAAERLFIIAPKTVDAAYQGHSRVDLSLQ